MSPADTSTRIDPTSRRWVLLALMCTMMLAAMDSTIVSTAIPQIVGDLGGFSLFSWVFSIYLLAQTVTIPIYGKLADIFGRKRILLIGTVVFLIGSTACALASNMVWLVVFRGLQGLGAGAVMATVATLAGDLYSVRERAAIQGWLSSVWGIAAILGPVLGGAFADYVSWRWIFLINVPIGLLAMILIVVFLHERFERRPHRIDYAGAVLILVAIGLLILGLLQGGQAWAWNSPQSVSIFTVATVLLAALVWVEQRAQEPMIPGWLWRWRLTAGANLATAGIGLVMMAPNAYLPTFAQSVLGHGAIESGLVLASMSLGWPVASSFSGRFYMRIGFRQTSLMGVVLVVIAVAGFVFMPHPASTWMVVADTVLLGAGFGFLSTPLLVGVQSVVGWEQRGVVTGGNMFSRYLGASLGAAMMGAIFNRGLSEHLDRAPTDLAAAMPADINGIIDALQQHQMPTAAVDYLREAIETATTHLYMAGLLVAFLMVAAVLMIPRRFEARPGAEAPGP